MGNVKVKGCLIVNRGLVSNKLLGCVGGKVGLNRRYFISRFFMKRGVDKNQISRCRWWISNNYQSWIIERYPSFKTNPNSMLVLNIFVLHFCDKAPCLTPCHEYNWYLKISVISPEFTQLRKGVLVGKRKIFSKGSVILADVCGFVWIIAVRELQHAYIKKGVSELE